MPEKVFEGNRILIYNDEDAEDEKGILLCTGNVHLFLRRDTTSELIQGLRQIAHSSSGSEIYQ